jgi:hypothetical protein
MAFRTTNDYAGRVLDLEVLQTVASSSGLIPLSFTISDDGVTRALTGLQKLVQRYTVLFFSPEGTTLFDTEQGTDFLPAVRRGSIVNREQMVRVFSFANAEVIRQLREDDANELLGGLPLDDERIDEAELLDFDLDFSTSTLFIKIRITNLAGQETLFVLPTTTPSRND